MTAKTLASAGDEILAKAFDRLWRETEGNARKGLRVWVPTGISGRFLEYGKTGYVRAVEPEVDGTLRVDVFVDSGAANLYREISGDTGQQILT